MTLEELKTEIFVTTNNSIVVLHVGTRIIEVYTRNKDIKRTYKNLKYKMPFGIGLRFFVKKISIKNILYILYRRNFLKEKINIYHFELKL
jgi:hypothetical protein